MKEESTGPLEDRRIPLGDDTTTVSTTTESTVTTKATLNWGEDETTVDRETATALGVSYDYTSTGETMERNTATSTVAWASPGSTMYTTGEYDTITSGVTGVTSATTFTNNNTTQYNPATMSTEVIGVTSATTMNSSSTSFWDERQDYESTKGIENTIFDTTFDYETTEWLTSKWVTTESISQVTTFAYESTMAAQSEPIETTEFVTGTTQMTQPYLPSMTMVPDGSVPLSPIMVNDNPIVSVQQSQSNKDNPDLYWKDDLVPTDRAKFEGNFLLY